MWVFSHAYLSKVEFLQSSDSASGLCGSESHCFKPRGKKYLVRVDTFYSGEMEGLACAEEVKVKAQTQEKC